MRAYALAAIVVCCASVAAAAAVLHASAQTSTDQIARGQYLVMSVGKCNDCHGPKLQGSSLIGLLKPGMPFAYRSPKIAGLPQLSTADAVTFLQTGRLPGGARARPPMPQYRFNHGDAAAVVAYLKSLK
ncbi:MAG: c-type cytochrome [Candidatus Eremiobacteraeota bacterium]|nr:c-type cytochrome [Candidatus Eremiobacteraeota bacterium]MBV9700951.1 c-type cytochrome [Candidatus Eremiobacteraeota bacterium]